MQHWCSGERTHHGGPTTAASKGNTAWRNPRSIRRPTKMHEHHDPRRRYHNPSNAVAPESGSFWRGSDPESRTRVTHEVARGVFSIHENGTRIRWPELIRGPLSHRSPAGRSVHQRQPESRDWGQAPFERKGPPASAAAFVICRPPFVICHFSSPFPVPHFLESGSPQSMRVTWGSGPGYSENWRQRGRITAFEERRP